MNAERPRGSASGKSLSSHPSRLAKRSKAERALEMRKTGMSYRRIAAKLGCGLSVVHGYIKEALAESAAAIQSSADELRAIELEKLDKWEASLQLGIRDVDPQVRAKSAAVLLKITESRRKLLGLDAPQKIEHSGNLYTVKEVSPDCPEWGEPAKTEPSKEERAKNKHADHRNEDPAESA